MQAWRMLYTWWSNITPAAVRGFHEVQEVRRRIFGDRPPLVTSVVVNRLLRSDSLIEVEAVAVRSGSSRRSFETGAIGMGSRAIAAVECSGLLIVSAGATTGDGDTARQAEAVYERVGALLAAAGASPSDAVRTIDYITPDALSSYQGTASVRQALFGDGSPAGTAVVVERLLDPDALLHVTAIAVVSDGPRRIYSPGWPRDGRLLGSPGAGKGKLVCLEGMTGADPETRAVTEGDVAAQTQVAYEKAAVVLSAAGLSMGHVVKTVDYTVPTALESYRATADVRRGFFESGYPVATGVVVNRLLRPEWLIQIDFTAMTD